MQLQPTTTAFGVYIILMSLYHLPIITLFLFLTKRRKKGREFKPIFLCFFFQIILLCIGKLVQRHRTPAAAVGTLEFDHNRPAGVRSSLWSLDVGIIVCLSEVGF